MAEQDISAMIGDAAPDGDAEAQQRSPTGDTPSSDPAPAGIDTAPPAIASAHVAGSFSVGASFPALSPLRSGEQYRATGSSAVATSPSIVSGTSRLTSPSSPPGSFPTPRSATLSAAPSAAEPFVAADAAPSRAAARSAGRPAHHHAAADTPGAGRLLTKVNVLFTLLGTVVTAGALLGAGRALGAARTLSLVAAVIAAVAVTIAVGVLLSRLTAGSGTPGRARRVDRRPSIAAVSTAPGVLILLASAMLATAAGMTVVGPGDDGVPRLELAAVTVDDERSGVSAEVTIAAGTAGDPIAVSLSAVGDPATVISSQVRQASGNTTDTVKVGGTVRDAKSVQVDVSLVGRRCRAVIAIRAVLKAEETRLTCRSV